MFKILSTSFLQSRKGVLYVMIVFPTLLHFLEEFFIECMDFYVMCLWVYLYRSIQTFMPENMNSPALCFLWLNG